MPNPYMNSLKYQLSQNMVTHDLNIHKTTPKQSTNSGFIKALPLIKGSVDNTQIISSSSHISIES